MTLPPVIWKPSPNFWKGPSGYPTKAIVNHRIVGTLTSARDRFMNPTSNASSHFGIGHNEQGKLVIWQFVALDDSAWTNGDVRDPTWPGLIPNVNPNLYTWTIEHEDGGAANRGVVTEEIWQASMDLQVILASGDPAKIRAAGVTVRNDSVARDGADIPRDKTGFIDHHQISGPNKPYCWRPWLDDPGFVNGSPSRRDQLLAALNALPAEEPADSLSPLELCHKRLGRVRAKNADLLAQVEELEKEAARVPRLLRRIRAIKELAAQIQEE
jgi:hypothetical protein